MDYIEYYMEYPWITVDSEYVSLKHSTQISYEGQRNIFPKLGLQHESFA